MAENARLKLRVAHSPLGKGPYGLPGAGGGLSSSRSSRCDTATCGLRRWGCAARARRDEVKGLRGAGDAPPAQGSFHDLHDPHGRTGAVVRQLNSHRIASLPPAGREHFESALADLDRLSADAIAVLEVAAMFGDGF